MIMLVKRKSKMSGVDSGTGYKKGDTLLLIISVKPEVES